ncbi:hypothetical protein DICVIV_03029 [Dictyocaulus viviparus]|uniref:Homeobox domain-containing protein n=1 Tax=Dictyocaulus viviparus TaxID=29172 RepID=A0A0D8Y470_DICVI|nr:hypothetical protein DICVIV_03029 [Dictyocaulus viviparus]
MGLRSTDTNENMESFALLSILSLATKLSKKTWQHPQQNVWFQNRRTKWRKKEAADNALGKRQEDLKSPCEQIQALKNMPCRTKLVLDFAINYDKGSSTMYRELSSMGGGGAMLKYRSSLIKVDHIPQTHLTIGSYFRKTLQS